VAWDSHGVVVVFELLVRFECQTQAFIRRRLLRNIGDSGHAYFGIAGLIFFVSLFAMLIAPPVAVAEAPPEAVIVGGLILGGFLMCATIVLAPIGLVLL
jgi:hypothetical protein